MEWFSGNIPEAIMLSKTKNAVFVVFITDGSEASATTEASIGGAGDELKKNFIAIKLSSDSDEAKQFNQIYPIVVLPSLYFINPNNGVPVEILAGAVTAGSLLAKLPAIMKDCFQQSTTEASSQSSDVLPDDHAESSSASDGISFENTSVEPTSVNIPLLSTSTAASSQSASASITVSAHTSAPAPTSTPAHTSTPAPAPASAPAPTSAPAPAPTSALAAISAPSLSASTSCSFIESSSPEETVSAPSDNTNNSAGAPLEAASLQSRDGAGSPDLSLDERVARARKLAELKRQQRDQEQFQKEHENEISRRQLGKSMHRIKQEQEEKEMRDLAAERKRDKEMDRLAREKVKAQIAADRAEREERAALLRGDVPAPPVPQPFQASNVPVTAASATTCRLKLRLPDGSSELAQFEPSVMLSEVRQYVVRNITLPFSRFKLVSSVHQRPFTDQDMNTSLADLGLAPSAIVLVMPSNLGTRSDGGVGSVVSTGGSWFKSLLWLVMLPVNAIMGLVSSFFGVAPTTAAPDSRSQDKQGNDRQSKPTEPARRATDRPKTAYGTRSQARYRRDGNIHRLGNESDDDDENNTWNGNSTQQM